MACGGQVGLQVVQRPAGGGVGYGQGQVAGLADLGVAAQLDADAVGGLAARAGRQRRGGRRGARDGDDLPVVSVGHLAAAAELGVDDVTPGGGEHQGHRELSQLAGRLGVDVGERAEVGAGGDEVHPYLVAEGEVGDWSAGPRVGEGHRDPGGLPGRDGAWYVEAHAHVRVGGVDRRDVGGHHGAHLRPHGHAGGLGPGQHAVHAAAGGVGPAQPGQARAEREREDRDGGQVGVLAGAGGQRRVQDLAGAGGPAEAAQPQGVGDHADRAHRHSGRGQHRIEQEAACQVQGAGGDRDEQDVVAERPAQALLDRGDGAAGQRDRGHDAVQVAADQGDVGGGDGHVGAGADRHAEVGPG